VKLRNWPAPVTISVAIVVLALTAAGYSPPPHLAHRSAEGVSAFGTDLLQVIDLVRNETVDLV